ncbi:MAG: MotA/TolQ/ExbB proton channel family protein [Nitrospira sp.]|nr:MotA/TolQ/ExbB proton channel family protein [Nitrospira sp.]MCP9465378.1 MotA/TolQ/ExbB proton channel family protein [Nitrospira sp.]
MDMSSGGVAFALSHATLEGKITISVLLVFSLVSWTIIVNKFRQLGKAKKRNGLFLEAYSQSRDLLSLFSKGPLKEFQGSPMYDLYYGGCEELKAQQEKYGAERVPRHGMNAVRIALERVLGESAVSLESGMIVLATAISGGPFVGLLGTVWGVMDTFSGIGRAQQATLTTMAPGVASALVATVAGLMVAIPSLFCYNYLVTKTKALTMELDNFAAHLETVFMAEYLLEKNGATDEDVEDYRPGGRRQEAEPSGAATAH